MQISPASVQFGAKLLLKEASEDSNAVPSSRIDAAKEAINDAIATERPFGIYYELSDQGDGSSLVTEEDLLDAIEAHHAKSNDNSKFVRFYDPRPLTQIDYLSDSVKPEVQKTRDKASVLPAQGDHGLSEVLECMISQPNIPLEQHYTSESHFTNEAFDLAKLKERLNLKP